MRYQIKNVMQYCSYMILHEFVDEKTKIEYLNKMRSFQKILEFYLNELLIWKFLVKSGSKIKLKF